MKIIHYPFSEKKGGPGGYKKYWFFLILEIGRFPIYIDELSNNHFFLKHSLPKSSKIVYITTRISWLTGRIQLSYALGSEPGEEMQWATINFHRVN